MRAVLGLGEVVVRKDAWAIALVAPLLAAAMASCGMPSAAAPTGATVPRASTSGGGPNRGYAVPAVITPAYVQSVLDALESVYSVATAAIVSADDLPPAALAHLRAVTTASFYGEQLAFWVQALSNGTSNYSATPGAVVDRLDQMVSASPSCVFALIERDYSALEKMPPPRVTSYVTLRPREDTDDPGHLNPTPWVFDFVGHNDDGSPVADQCAA